MSAYTKEKPKRPGWYWCRNVGDLSGEVWEAVVRIDRRSDGFVASWMTAPGEVGLMHEADWSSACEWVGPLVAGSEGDGNNARDGCDVLRAEIARLNKIIDGLNQAAIDEEFGE